MEPKAAVGNASSLSQAKSWLAWLRRDWFLLLTAVLALLWIGHRAAVQSITLDEANTYHRWVAPASAAHWTPHSNNHVLNSALMRLSIALFGLGHLTMRAPALLGGLLYVVAAFRLAMLLASGGLFRWAVLVCFVYNPMVMDYLVAARGYGLALGFLTLAIYLLAGMVLREDEWDERALRKGLMLISACVALSICASYAFAYASGFVLLAAVMLAFGRTEQKWRLLAAAAWPVAAIVVVLAGSALMDFPKAQLFWGAKSWAECWRELRDACFRELNPNLVNPLLARIFGLFQRFGLLALGVCLGGHLMAIVLRRRSGSRESQNRKLLGGVLALVLGFTLLAHWLQFLLLGIPLPLERTSLFVVPLATAWIAAVFSIAPVGRVTWRNGGIAVIFLTACCFLGELRDGYFREWRIGAEVRAAFPVVLDTCRLMGVREVISDQNLTSSLNFYRTLYEVKELDELRLFETIPEGGAVYVLLETRNEQFLRKAGLKTVWRGPVSGLVVLTR